MTVDTQKGKCICEKNHISLYNSKLDGDRVKMYRSRVIANRKTHTFLYKKNPCQTDNNGGRGLEMKMYM